MDEDHWEAIMKQIIGILLVGVLWTSFAFAHCGNCGVGEEEGSNKQKKVACSSECACGKNKAKAEDTSVESKKEEVK